MIARVAALYRYPVKSMDGVELSRVAVVPKGIPGDRAWALIETGTGKPASAKRHAALMLCRARFLDEPAVGAPPPPAEVELPDGSRLRTDDAAAGARMSRFLGVEVAFGRNDDGAGHFDSRPLHLLTESALAHMRGKTGLDFDPRRFRPNLLIATDETGRPEDAWIGRTVRAGAASLRTLKPVQRCVMTTLPQPTLAPAKGIFSAVFADGGALGIYAEALAPAAISVGDPVRLTDPAETA